MQTDRFCPQCGADVIGNDPHAPWCSVGLGDPNVMGDSVPIPAQRGGSMLAVYAALYEYTEPQELNPDDVESFLGDIVADLLHYAASKNIGTGFLDQANLHYAEESQAIQ